MNLIEALKTGKDLRRPIAKHLGSGGDGWLGNQYVRDYLLAKQDRYYTIWVDATDLLADDWEIRKSASDKVIDRINHLHRETGKHPTVLDLPHDEFEQVRSELLSNSKFIITESCRGTASSHGRFMQVFTPSGPTILVKGKQ